MKSDLLKLSQHYLTALRKHLKEGARPSFQPAWRLGHRAVAQGLELLGLARIHERAVVALELGKGRASVTRRAEAFFAEAITPLVETYAAARQSRADLVRLNATLNRRTSELAVSHERLQRSAARSKGVEAVLKRCGADNSRLRQESLCLPEGLRRLTHRILAAQEQERLTMSHQLQDEIAQTLLGIQVRLLGLRTAARGNSPNLTNEIASTQKLVEASIRSINRFAHELELRFQP